jgi:hypothetical protein
MGKILDGSRILIEEGADDSTSTEKLDALRICLYEFVENASRSRLGELSTLPK